MSKNILGIISLILATTGIAYSSVFPAEVVNGKLLNPFDYRNIHPFSGLKYHDYPLWEDPYNDPFDLLSKHIEMLKARDKLRRTFNYQKKAGEITTTKQAEYSLSTGNPISKEESNNLVSTKVHNIGRFTSLPTEEDREGKHSVLYYNANKNELSSSGSMVSSDSTTQSTNQETRNNAYFPNMNSTEPDRIQIVKNQSVVADTNTSSVSPITYSKNGAANDISNYDATEITGDSSANYESTSTVNKKAQTSVSEIAYKKTTSNIKTTPAYDGFSTKFDSTTERTKETLFTFDSKSTTVENGDFESTDGKKDSSKSQYKPNGSSSFYTSTEPSYQIIDKVTKNWYLISDSQTGSRIGTKLPENNVLTQPEQAIEIQSIRTLKIVVSVVFMVIAFVAGTVLIVFIFKVKRQEVQYDQLTLIP